MDADNYYFGRRAMEERAAAENALSPIAQSAHFELALRYEQLSDATDAMSDERAVPTGANEGHEKFGVEQHALYDFRDYGLD